MMIFVKENPYNKKRKRHWEKPDESLILMKNSKHGGDVTDDNDSFLGFMDDEGKTSTSNSKVSSTKPHEPKTKAPTEATKSKETLARNESNNTAALSDELQSNDATESKENEAHNSSNDNQQQHSSSTKTNSKLNKDQQQDSSAAASSSVDTMTKEPTKQKVTEENVQSECLENTTQVNDSPSSTETEASLVNKETGTHINQQQEATLSSGNGNDTGTKNNTKKPNNNIGVAATHKRTAPPTTNTEQSRVTKKSKQVVLTHEFIPDEQRAMYQQCCLDLNLSSDKSFTVQQLEDKFMSSVAVAAKDQKDINAVNWYVFNYGLTLFFIINSPVVSVHYTL